MHDKKKISENQRRFIKAVNPEPSKKRAELLDRRSNRALRKASAFIAIEVLLALDERGWSQEKLAEALGVSPQQVSKWMTGRENITLATIVKLEGVLDIKLLADERKESVFHRTKNIRGVKKSFEVQRTILQAGYFCHVFVQSKSTKEFEIEIGIQTHYTVCRPNKGVQASHLG